MKFEKRLKGWNDLNKFIETDPKEGEIKRRCSANSVKKNTKWSGEQMEKEAFKFGCEQVPWRSRDLCCDETTASSRSSLRLLKGLPSGVRGAPRTRLYGIEGGGELWQSRLLRSIEGGDGPSGVLGPRVWRPNVGVRGDRSPIGVKSPSGEGSGGVWGGLRGRSKSSGGVKFRPFGLIPDPSELIGLVSSTGIPGRMFGGRDPRSGSELTGLPSTWAAGSKSKSSLSVRLLWRLFFFFLFFLFFFSFFLVRTFLSSVGICSGESMNSSGLSSSSSMCRRRLLWSNGTGETSSVRRSTAIRWLWLSDSFCFDLMWSKSASSRL